MASLVNVTREGRLFLKIGGVIFGVLLLVFVFIKGGQMVRDAFFPKPPEPPKEEFGQLPAIIFPEESGEVLEYRVNTVDGTLPTVPIKVNVYKTLENAPDLLALEEAKNTLDSANFVEGQVKLSETLYRWTQSGTGVVIEYDIVSHNFKITSDFLYNPSLSSTNILPSEDIILNDVKGFLTTIDSHVDNINYEKSKVTYLELQNGVLVEAQNLGQARYARVSLYNEDIDETEIVYGTPEESLMTFIVSYPNNRFTIVDGIFYNHIINIEEVSDYPLKSVNQAFEELKQGNAYIMNPQNLQNIDITDVKKAYYLTYENQGYLLPVIVFTGVNFKAYVEGLPQSSIETESNSEVPQN